MLDFLVNNIGTIIVAIVLLVVVLLIVRKLVRDKRKGVSIVCGCKCEDCASHGCHEQAEQD